MHFPRISLLSKYFLSGPVDPSKISIFSGISTVVVTKGVYYPLKVETRDKYNNLCELENEDFFKVHAKKVSVDYCYTTMSIDNESCGRISQSERQYSSATKCSLRMSFSVFFN